VTRIVTVANQKGGVGKTDLSVNLACYMASMGKKVLLVDMDPQANATDYLCSQAASLSTANLLLDKHVTLQQTVEKTNYQNLDIVPSSQSLSAAQIQLAADVTQMQFKLKQKLKNIEDYDYVVIDTPPSLGLLTINAFTATNEVLIALQAHYFALDGLAKLLETIENVENTLNPKISLGGIVLTMYDKRTLLSRHVSELVRKEFNGKVFETVIPVNVRLAESPSYHKPILEYAPKSTGATAYMNLAREFLNGKRSG
jgi:chromosome partitioning protein